MAAKRKQLSKRDRFEVFKRDLFACQYCGATPPRVILHVDHILAVAGGGGNDLDNLATACAECNLGKGAKALAAVPQPMKERAAEISEREEQLRGYQEILEAKRDRLEEEINRVAQMYEKHEIGYTLTDSARVSVRRFIERLGVHACVDAMEIACTARRIYSNRRFRYFCGICWRRISETDRG